MEVRLLAIVSNIVIPAYLFLYESPESEGGSSMACFQDLSDEPDCVIG